MTHGVIGQVRLCEKLLLACAGEVPRRKRRKIEEEALAEEAATADAPPRATATRRQPAGGNAAVPKTPLEEPQSGRGAGAERQRNQRNRDPPGRQRGPLRDQGINQAKHARGCHGEQGDVQGIAGMTVTQLVDDPHTGETEKRNQHEPVAGGHFRRSAPFSGYAPLRRRISAFYPIDPQNIRFKTGDSNR